MSLRRSLPIGATPWRVLVSACLVLSGASALVYEVLWLRKFSLEMGSTVYALAAVLTAFFGGLALGSLAGGRLASAGSPLRRYAALEAGIAVSALALPFVLGALRPLQALAYRELGGSFVAYSFVQFLLAALALLLPTLCMGATLPVAMAALLGRGRSGIAVPAGRLYGLNSLGGVLGAGAAGLALLPHLGMRGTTLVAVSVNAAVALAALLASRKEVVLEASGNVPARAGSGEGQRALPDRSARTGAARSAPARVPWPAPRARLLLLCYGLSGFAALALEVGWARIVSLTLGSTTYGFTTTLITFIAGLAAGSLLVPRFAAVRADPVRAVFVLHLVIAFASLLTLPYVGALPARVARLLATSADLPVDGVLAIQMLLVLLTIVGPTFAMGGIFPLVADLVHRERASAASAVGSAYAANTVGNILGSFAGGFLLVPLLGMRGTVVVSALLAAAAGLLYALPAARAAPRAAAKWVLPAFLAVGVAAVAAPAWDREIVVSAPFFNRTLVRGEWTGERALADALRGQYGEIVDYREGATTAASVRRDGPILWLQSAGIPEASNYPSIQNFIGQLPLLLHGDAREVLVVGLGGGGTLASVLAHPVERVEVVEISSEVVELARRHFAGYTGRSLADPRTHLVIGDGRNHLRHAERRYDVIVSQPSVPWLSGSASLFTREFFVEIRDHLAPGGIACGWFWGGSEELAPSILRAWQEAFPDAYVFAWGGAQAVLIGLRDGGRLSAANVERALARAEVRGDLARLALRSPADVLGTLVLGPQALARWTAGARVNDDDNGWVEFASRGGLAIRAGDPAGRLAALREDPIPLVDASLSSPEATAIFRQDLARGFREHQSPASGGPAPPPARGR